MEFLGVVYLQSQHQQNDLDAEFPSVHVIPQEKIAGVGRPSEALENAEQVEKLAVDVSHDDDGGLQFEESGLVNLIKGLVLRTDSASLRMVLRRGTATSPLLFNSWRRGPMGIFSF